MSDSEFWFSDQKQQKGEPIIETWRFVITSMKYLHYQKFV